MTVSWIWMILMLFLMNGVKTDDRVRRANYIEQFKKMIFRLLSLSLVHDCIDLHHIFAAQLLHGRHKASAPS